MKVETSQVTVVRITLSQEEALWLRNIMQNSLTADEDHEQCEMRRRFWEALQPIL